MKGKTTNIVNKNENVRFDLLFSYGAVSALICLNGNLCIFFMFLFEEQCF